MATRSKNNGITLTDMQKALGLIGAIGAAIILVFSTFAKSDDLIKVEKESKEYARELNQGTKEDIKELKEQQKETAKEMRDYFIEQQILLKEAIRNK